MTQHIWVVSELYYPEQSATGHILTGIAEGLTEGNLVSVLCSQPTYVLRGTHAPARESHNGVEIRRCRGITLDKDRLLYRLLNICTISLSIFLNAITQVRRNECVLVVTNPPTLPVLMAIACWLKGAKCILIAHDLYPQVLVVTGLLKQDSLITRLISKVMVWTHKRMTVIVVLGRDMCGLIAHCLPGSSPKLSIIPNWADLHQIVPQLRESNQLLHKLGLQNKFVVQYSGNMGRTHDLGIVIQCAIQCRQQEHIHFLLIGDGAKKKWVEAAIQANKLTNVTLLAPCSRSELNVQLSACDVALISFLPGMAGVSVPSRMYNVLAAGKPIIAVADTCSELAFVVQEEQVGWVVPPGHAIALADAVCKAQSDLQSLHEMGARARKAAESKYSFAHVIESYQELITKLA